jgi:hypothetical protein
MPFKLTAEQLTERDALAVRLEEERTKVDLAVSDFHDALTVARNTLQEALDAYNEVLVEAKAYAEGIAQDAENYFEEKSERWQEGEKGEALRELIDAWQSVDLEPLEVDMPDSELDLDVNTHDETLCELPTEPEV